MERYAASQRAYHTIRHVEECLACLDRVRDAAARPAEVELALWFHDVIYDPRRNDNEARSADMATRAILEAGGRDALAARIDVLIVATADHSPAEDPDTRLLLDIDLSILGAPDARFDEYERQIRQEYAWVPSADYQAARGRFLTSMLERRRIYQTEALEELEAPARINLRRALAQAAS